MQLDFDQVLGVLSEENKGKEAVEIISSESKSSPPLSPSSKSASNNNNSCNNNINSNSNQSIKSNGVQSMNNHQQNHQNHNGSTTTITTTTTTTQIKDIKDSSSVSHENNTSNNSSVNNVAQKRLVASHLKTTETKNEEVDLLPREIKENGGVVDGYLARDENVSELEGPAGPAKWVWRNIIIFTYLHMAVAYSVYLILTGNVMWKTLVFAWILHFWGGMGITAGAHRCWSHKAYKARTPLKILLTFMQTLAFQNSIWEWVRDHRVHHKYAETNADPHNAKRGFFFAHIGWLLCRKHELVRVKGKQIDMSDIESDPILAFQKKYHLPLGLVVSFILPAIVPNLLWGESYMNGFLVAGLCRYAFTLHITWLVNSAAHMWGPKPYDKSINPAENKSVAFWAFGEGWHNYHHVFPWDYKTAELGHYQFNLTTAFVDFFAAIGWAYDLKTVPKNVVMQRVKRTGDGSHHHHGHGHEAPYAWDDSSVPAEDAKVTITLNKRD